MCVPLGVPWSEVCPGVLDPGSSPGQFANPSPSKKKEVPCVLVMPLACTDLKHKIGEALTCFSTMPEVADGGIVFEPDCSCPISCLYAFQLLFFICYRNAIILTSNAVSQIF